MHKKKHSWAEFIPKSWVYCKNYSFALFKSDLLAGITVGLVALPLAMAFGIASGVTPEKGLYTAIIAGFLISLLGGCRLQIGGPTGAFVVIIYDIIQRTGYDGLVTVTLLASLLLLIAAFFRLGSLVKYIPYPLITGFTTGIAVIIFSSQVKDFFGLHIDKVPANFIPKWGAIFSAMPTLDPLTVAVSTGTLLLIIGIRRFVPILPWGIISVAISTAVVFFFNLPVETIASRFGQIQNLPPMPTWPHFSFAFSDINTLVLDVVTVAFLIGIESLLSAIVADGMSGSRHKANCEIMAQGLANIGSIFFGGIPATGALARTATNIKTGAKTPVSGMIHALTLLAIVLAFAPIVSLIPLASLSAILFVVSWNMSEIKNFKHLFKSPAGDVVVLLTTFLLTVLVDLTVGVAIGMIFAAFLFIKKLGDLSGARSLTTSEDAENDAKEAYEVELFNKEHLPQGIEIYEVTGPFFFGIADSLKNVLSSMEYPPKVFILRLRKVPIIDASGMHSLTEFYYKCKHDKTTLFLSGVHHQLLSALRKFGVVKLIGEDHIFTNIDAALSKAKALVNK